MIPLEFEENNEDNNRKSLGESKTPTSTMNKTFKLKNKNRTILNI